MCTCVLHVSIGTVHTAAQKENPQICMVYTYTCVGSHWHSGPLRLFYCYFCANDPLKSVQRLPVKEPLEVHCIQVNPPTNCPGRVIDSVSASIRVQTHACTRVFVYLHMYRRI